LERRKTHNSHLNAENRRTNKEENTKTVGQKDGYNGRINAGGIR